MEFFNFFTSPHLHLYTAKGMELEWVSDGVESGGVWSWSFVGKFKISF